VTLCFDSFSAVAFPDSDAAEQQASEYAHGRPTHVCPSERFRELLLYGRKKVSTGFMQRKILMLMKENSNY